jgi:hypothetical protein
LVETPPSDDVDDEPSSPSAPPSADAQLSPTSSASILLRATAVCGVLAAAMGVIVAPGMRGTATEKVVEVTDRVAASLAYLMYGLVVALLIRGGYELLRNHRVHVVVRVLVGAGAATAAAMAAPALHARLPPVASVILTVAAIVAIAPAAWSAVRAPHTRAVSVVLLLLAIAAFARLGAWELALAAWERTSTPLLKFARGLATAGVVFEGLAQLVAAAWLGTRAKLWGQLLSSLAIVAAFVITWRGMLELHADTPKWQAVLHTALADAAAPPIPPGLAPIATFLASAALLLALVAAAQPGQVAAIVCAMALALISRGALDAPLRALSGIAAAVWIVVAWIDDRAMWRALIDTRKRRIAEGASDREANGA